LTIADHKFISHIFLLFEFC